MCKHMIDEFAILYEDFSTLVAFEWPFTGVSLHVKAKVASLIKHVPADFTPEWFMPSVCPDM